MKEPAHSLPKYGEKRLGRATAGRFGHLKTRRCFYVCAGYMMGIVCGFRVKIEQFPVPVGVYGTVE